MKKKFAVIGLGHFGLNLSLNLMERGAEVLAIDVDEERVDQIKDKVSHAVILDSSDIKSLRGLGLEDMDAVVVAIGENFEASVLTTAHLQELKAKKIINRVVSPVHERLLKLMKIEDLILPEAEASNQLARKLTMSGVVDSLELTDDYSIVEVKVPVGFVGKSLGDVDLRKRYNLNLITIIRKIETAGMITLGDREKVEVLGVPTSDMVFSDNDVLVVFGKEKSISSLANE